MKNKDFEDFCNEFEGDLSSDVTKQESLSPVLHDRIANTYSLIIKKMNPSLSSLTRKVLLTHLFASLVTLSLCNQMGIRLFFSGPGLMEYFMNFGYWACMGFCGAFYMGSTFLVLPFVTSLDERNFYKKQLPLLVGGLSALSLLSLTLIGSSVSFGLVLIWLLGAEISGLGAFYLGSKLQSKFSL